MRVTKLYCDIDGCTNEVSGDTMQMQVIFITNQTDGSASDRYFDDVNIDICDSCRKKILKSGKYLIASGGQGYNNYKIQED